MRDLSRRKLMAVAREENTGGGGGGNEKQEGNKEEKEEGMEKREMSFGKIGRRRETYVEKGRGKKRGN